MFLPLSPPEVFRGKYYCIFNRLKILKVNLHLMVLFDASVYSRPKKRAIFLPFSPFSPSPRKNPHILSTNINFSFSHQKKQKTLHYQHPLLLLFLLFPLLSLACTRNNPLSFFLLPSPMRRSWSESEGATPPDVNSAGHSPPGLGGVGTPPNPQGGAVPPEGSKGTERVDEEIGALYASMNNVRRAISTLNRSLSTPTQTKQKDRAGFFSSGNEAQDELERAYYAMSTPRQDKPQNGTSTTELETSMQTLCTDIHTVVNTLTHQSGLAEGFARTQEELENSRAREASMESVIVTLQKHIEALEAGGAGGEGNYLLPPALFLEDRTTQTELADEGDMKIEKRVLAKKRAKANFKHPMYLKLSCVGCHIPMNRRRWQHLPRATQTKLGEMQFEVDEFIHEKQEIVNERILPRHCVFCEEKPIINEIDGFGAPEKVVPKKSKAETEKELFMRILLKQDGDFLKSELAVIAAAVCIASVSSCERYDTLQDLPDEVATLVVINKWRALGDALDVNVTKNPKQRLGLRLDNDLKVLGFDPNSPAADNATPPIPTDWYLLALNHVVLDKMDSMVKGTLQSSPQVHLTFARRRVSERPQEDLKEILYREANVATIIEQHQTKEREGEEEVEDTEVVVVSPETEKSNHSEEGDEECEGPLQKHIVATAESESEASEDPFADMVSASLRATERGSIRTPLMAENPRMSIGASSAIPSEVSTVKYPEMAFTIQPRGSAGGDEEVRSEVSNSLVDGGVPVGGGGGAALTGSFSAASETPSTVMSGSTTAGSRKSGWLSRMLKKKPPAKPQAKKEVPAPSDEFPSYDD